MKFNNELKNKVVLVTGGTQGIGEAMVKGFTEEGSKVILNGRKMDAKVQKVIYATGSEDVMGDISDTDRARAIVDEAWQKHDRIDVLVANAAGMSMNPFLEHEQKSWWNNIDINLTGHMAVIQETVKRMKKQKSGTIVIISSFFGTIGWKNATAYGSSKSGLLTLGQYIAREYKKYGIRACIIVPGVIDTPQLNVDATDLGISLDEVREMYRVDIAAQRLGKPSEIADMAMFMATEDGGRALSGRHVQVSGGEYRTTPYYL